MFRNFIKKLHLEKYVSSKLILGLDLIISVGVSLFALFLTNVLFTSFTYDFGFILYIVGSSLLSSAIFFLLLQTHKSIIRHSTLRELWKLGVATLGKGVLMVAIIKFTYPVLLDNKDYPVYISPSPHRSPLPWAKKRNTDKQCCKKYKQFFHIKTK